MSLLNNQNYILDEDITNDSISYTLPKLVVSKPEAFSFWKGSVTTSALAHILTPILCWIISIILLLFGINLSLFNKIKHTPKKDIEFVLVDKPGKPRDPNTKNRADMDSRSGGVNDPTRKVSLPSPKPQKQQKTSTPASKPTPKVQQKPVVKQPVQKTVSKPVQQPQKTVEKPSPAKPTPPTARPSSKPIASPTPTAKPSTPFNIPAPKSAPVGKTLSTGPIGGTSAPTGLSKSGTIGGPVTSSGTYAPRPSLSPSANGGSGGQLSRGSSASGTGNLGNPGGGGGAPGIDALREPDFGPYMRELQRRIKLNWDPPKGNESKTVVLLFKIAKDGRLLSCRIHRSSGLPSADQAALKAVELTAPFRPLPSDFSGQNIDIQFTFDYRVFGASKY